MQLNRKIDYQAQIEKALERAIWKKVLYFYDQYGNKHLLGVFRRRTADKIKRVLEKKDLINRVSEFEVLTNQPDSHFNFARVIPPSQHRR